MEETPQEPKSKDLKKPNDWPPLVVGGVLVIGYFLVTSFLIHKGVPDGASPYISELVTTLRDALMLFLFWCYGSNASSNRKTDIIARSNPVDVK